MTHVMNTYARLPVAFERGEGSWLWDANGKRYLDAMAGVAVCGLGHGHPRYVAALREQVGKLVHTSNLYQITLQEKLADRLAAISGMDNVFFCNSGCEANEAAIKLARLYGHKKNVEAPAIVVLEKAFHGRTIATLSATGSRKVQAGFEPLLAGFVRVPFDDLEARRIAAWWRYWWSSCRARAASMSAMTTISAACARSAMRTGGCSCSMRCKAAWGAPEDGSRSSTPA